MSKTYRTFKNIVGDVWRWDGEKMEIFCGMSWSESCFTSPEELLRRGRITETTPKP